jgi:hypothetical protein
MFHFWVEPMQLKFAKSVKLAEIFFLRSVKSKSLLWFRSAEKLSLLTYWKLGQKKLKHFSFQISASQFD